MRVYLPSTMTGLSTLHEVGALRGPLRGHAITTAVRADLPDADDDELSYAVLMAAAYDSLLLLADSPQPACRVVVVAEVPDQMTARSGVEATEVTVDGDVPRTWVQAVHIDDDDAADAVRVALAAIPAATAGDPAALATVSLTAHDLLWYATQEIPDLVTQRS